MPWNRGRLGTFVVSCALTLFAGCSVAPYKYPDVPPRQDLVALGNTRIFVKQEFRYVPTLTAIVLPAGEYLPVRTDADGTYYESPRGLLVLPAAGAGFLVRGGIYRRLDVSRGYEFSLFGPPLAEPLHSMWGLSLKGKIECTPACVFK